MWMMFYSYDVFVMHLWIKKVNTMLSCHWFTVVNDYYMSYWLLTTTQVEEVNLSDASQKASRYFPIPWKLQIQNNGLD